MMAAIKIGVLGSGAWGTALAETQAARGRDVTLWARNPSVANEIAETGANLSYLPGVALSPALKVTTSLGEAAGNDILLLVPPAQALRALARQLKPLLGPQHTAVICSKGIEQESGVTLDRVLAEELPGIPTALLSGPGFAGDVARGLPAALTLAAADEARGRALCEALSHPGLRLYWTSDVTGVALGGSVKNVLSIAAGILDGKKLGGSAHAALVTRGFAELRRLGDALGARPETLMGLSGLGDLILTCGSAQSRNMSLGRALGHGETLSDILGARRAVTEGVYTAAAVKGLSDKLKIDMPISQAVAAILDGRLTVDGAIAGLLNRPLKHED